MTPPNDTDILAFARWRDLAEIIEATQSETRSRRPIGQGWTISVISLSIKDDAEVYARYCTDYLKSQPDAELPSLEELATFLETECPLRSKLEADSRLMKSVQDDLRFETAARSIEKEHDEKGVVAEFVPVSLCAVPIPGPASTAMSLATILTTFEEALQKNPDLRHPLAPLIRAWRERPTYIQPDKSLVLTAGKSRLTRIPNHLTTVALAEWEEKEPQLRMVTVDGTPVASATANKPDFYRPRQPKRVLGQQKLFDLPGNREAESLVLLLMRSLERSMLPETGSIDRRAPIHADVFYTLSLACAMTKPLTVDLEQFGAWLTGRYTTEGIHGNERDLLRKRAFRALDWARGWVMTKKGHPLALLDVNTVGLLEGRAELRPWGWGLALGTASVGWRLTGAVANAATRAAAASDGRTGDPTHSRASGFGTFGRIVAALEDHIGASGRRNDTDSRDRLLVPERTGGPGPVDFITANSLMARAGFVWNPCDKKQANKMRQLWRSMIERFDHGGYILGTGPLAEAPAGDTVEVLDIVKGSGHKAGGIHFRASSRFVEAYAKTKGHRTGDGLDHTPLPRLLNGR